MFCRLICDTEKELFTDSIYAFKYGPVVDKVYKRYKEYGYKPIEEEKQDINATVSEMPAKSRTLFAENGTWPFYSEIKHEIIKQYHKFETV